ncbi:MAG: DNA internalization-related competence protein ComEC/Rec2 [Bacteroidales bacterium]|nr:DNA internalization-related competence protein ComEC/Rec2 [Bacteroidales bacterium]MCM1414640.1 DNA internalization-related competence protein ComEC/Rec2 [bacterium]MCM1424665.1 DNA internalization-related competence protein ComEC/Rec2 [bacterium]
MRRPLCLLGLAFAAVLLLGGLLIPKETGDYGGLDREKMTVLGVVTGKEHKISQEKEVSVLSLGQVIVLKTDRAESLIRILNHSEKDRSRNIGEYTAKQIRAYCKKNRESLCLSGAEDVEGLLCYLEGEEPAVGSLVVMEGKFYAFSRATNPGEFDAAGYYRTMGQQGRLMQALLLADDGTEDVFREGLYQCRNYLSLLLRACCPEREAAVLGAMLLGEKGLLDEEIKGLYQRNGIVHILAISGLHLSLLGMGFYRLMQFLRTPKPVNIILTVALMYCYGVMTGMGVSVVRALVMFSMKLIADLLGRSYDLFTAMMTAALLILVRQPLYLFHSGFQFSFGAICGIGFLQKVSVHFPKKPKAINALFTGVWISLSTLPVYLCSYYEFPPYSVLLNLMVIPCMGIVLGSGVLTLAAGAFYLPLGRAAALPGIAVLTLYEKCCGFCAELPGSRWVTGRPANVRVIFFLILLAVPVLFAKKMRRRQFFAGVIFAAAILVVRVPAGFELTFLDVGQGDCIYVSGSGGKHILIDGGSSDQSDVDEYRILPFLKYRGVSFLDAVFVTHPDSDHENGIRGMLENCEESGVRIGALVMPDAAQESRNGNYMTLVSLAESRGVAVRYISCGDRLSLGKVMLTCIHPQKGYANQDTNAYSTVLSLTYGDFSALLTGDLEGEGESLVTQRLARMRGGTAQLPERFTLLKVAHHGSRNSTAEDFLALTRPQIALISAGRGNSYGHPHKETIERLQDQSCRIYRTDTSGAVTFRVRGKGLRVEAFLER